MEGAAVFDPAQPAAQVGDFLNFVRLAGMEGYPPFVAALKPLGFVLVFKPRVAQQDANGFPQIVAQPVENNAPVGFAKVVERDVQRVLGWRCEFGLKAEVKTALAGR